VSGKIIYSMSVSLDGFVETPDRSLDWVIVDEELHRFFNEQARETRTSLYGRRLYQLMAAYWPTADEDPSIPDFMVEFASIWRDKPKVVFSKTLDTVEWNSRLAMGTIPEEIARLREQPDNDMELGGPNLAATFMQLGLIDEYRLFVQPVVLGAGTPFFPPLDDKIDLRLVETKTFESGVVYLRYERVQQTQ
jgi:dihydrofolate reductase